MGLSIEVHAGWVVGSPFLLGHLGVYDTGSRERFDFEFAGDVRSHGLTPGVSLMRPATRTLAASCTTPHLTATHRKERDTCVAP